MSLPFSKAKRQECVALIDNVLATSELQAVVTSSTLLALKAALKWDVKPYATAIDELIAERYRKSWLKLNSSSEDAGTTTSLLPDSEDGRMPITDSNERVPLSEDEDEDDEDSTRRLDAVKEYKMSSHTLMCIKTRDNKNADDYFHPRPRPKRGIVFNPRDGLVGGHSAIHPGKLCDFCANLNIADLLASGDANIMGKARKVSKYHGHHRTPQRLEASAVRCPLCRLFYRELASQWARLLQANTPEPEGPHWGKSRFKIWIWNGDYERTTPRSERLRYLVLEWLGAGIEATAEVLITAPFDSAAASLGDIVDDIEAPSIQGILAQGTWNQILALMRNCQKSHSRCKYAGPTSPWTKGLGLAFPEKVTLPTRVVVVDLKNPRLLETNNTEGSYAALSHCWGQISTLKTTRRNLEAHKTHIDFSSTFPTFRDALVVCEMLNIKYIWIDSLCIVQHDPADPLSNQDDFLRESKRMGQIYGQATLTIAATGASDLPTMGLFRGERHMLRELVEVPFRYDRNDKVDGYFYASPKPKDFANEILDSQLFTRGWVLQERILSPRYLHFGREQWFWQCREVTVAESDGSAGTSNDHTGADMGMLQAILGRPVDIQNWWAQVVEIYTQLDFTVIDDRMHAILGLMEQIRSYRGHTHSWGMWIQLLHLQLLWFPKSIAQHAKPTVKTFTHSNRAALPPSWSWLSSLEEIRWPTGPDHNQFIESGQRITYPAGTTQKSEIGIGFLLPEMATQPDGSKRRIIVQPGEFNTKYRATDPWTSILIVQGCRKSVNLIAIDLKPQMETPKQNTSRLGPLMALAQGMMPSSYQYRYTYRVVEHPNNDALPMSDIGFAILDQPPQADVQKTPLTAECLLVSSNLVSADGMSYRKSKMKKGEPYVESPGDPVSLNVLLLEKCTSPTTTSTTIVYRRLGMGVILKQHINWFQDCSKTTLVLR